MTLVSLSNDKKISHHRKQAPHNFTVSEIEPKCLFTDAFALPFSLASLPERQEEEIEELRKVFHFFFDGLSLPQTNFLPWFVSHLPMMAWEADSLPGSLSIFFLAKQLFKHTEIAFFEEIKQFLLRSREIKMVKFSHQDFALELSSSGHFFAGEIKFLAQSAEGMQFAKKALPLFKETCLKCFRSYRDVVAGPQKKSNPFKIPQIKADLTRLCARFPELVDENLFRSFEIFSALTTETFREKREMGALKRIFLSLEFVKRKFLSDDQCKDSSAQK
ncbi:MAG: hypothetical protein AAF443_02230 [Chlamydiota bacterium]